jgi:hypothetical protein
MKKPILTLDFDGVIHSYSSGWKGASVIADMPVPGAIEFILNALGHYTLAIHSSRSHQWGGTRAMKKWLKKHLIIWMNRETDNYHTLTDWLNASKLADFNPGMEPWDIALDEWADSIIKKIQWPWFKPASFMTIDDRAVTFTGVFPDLGEIAAFKPWNKKVV